MHSNFFLLYLPSFFLHRRWRTTSCFITTPRRPSPQYIRCPFPKGQPKAPPVPKARMNKFPKKLVVATSFGIFAPRSEGSPKLFPGRSPRRSAFFCFTLCLDATVKVLWDGMPVPWHNQPVPWHNGLTDQKHSGATALAQNLVA